MNTLKITSEDHRYSFYTQQKVCEETACRELSVSGKTVQKTLMQFNDSGADQKELTSLATPRAVTG